MFTKNYRNMLTCLLGINTPFSSSTNVSNGTSVIGDNVYNLFRNTSGNTYYIASTNGVYSRSGGESRGNVGHIWPAFKWGPMSTELDSYLEKTSSTYGSNDGGSAPKAWILFGTNDADESVDDYTIEAIPNLTVAEVGRENTETVNQDGSVDRVIVFTVLNSNDTSKTIKEFGLCVGCPTAYLSYSSSSYYCYEYLHQTLIYRKKLTTPITLEANQSFRFSISIHTPAITIN